MNRAVVLQASPTRRKLQVLKEFSGAAVECSNWMLSLKKPGESAASLQARTLREAKKKYGFHVQVICSLVRSLAKSRSRHFRRTTVKFNVPRNCKTFRMKSFFFVELGLYPRSRLAVPIEKNRDWDRFAGLLGNGWTCKTYGLNASLNVVAYLSKEDERPPSARNVLGIDINAKNFAYSIMSPRGAILRQGYLGQQIWRRRRHFEERRATLQSLHAIKKLKLMKHRQRNYIRTNLGQMVREVILLARKYVADVSIERLSKFKPRGRQFNRRVLTIPFYLFHRILEARCFDNGIVLSEVDPYNTSKWCSRCGAVNAGHVKGNYSQFRCRVCGLVMNSDRKASLAVAAKTFLERDGLSNQALLQISGKRVPVSGLLRSSSMTQGQTAVPLLGLERRKLTN